MATVGQARQVDVDHTMVKPIPAQAEIKGLCGVCRYSSDCTFPRTPGRAVCQCEEFEGYMPLTVRALSGSKPKKLKTSQKNTEKNDKGEEFRGLCRDCEERLLCTFHRPVGGVWHCEEYR